MPISRRQVVKWLAGGTALAGLGAGAVYLSSSSGALPKPNPAFLNRSALEGYIVNREPGYFMFQSVIENRSEGGALLEKRIENNHPEIRSPRLIRLLINVEEDRLSVHYRAPQEQEHKFEDIGGIVKSYELNGVEITDQAERVRLYNEGLKHLVDVLRL
jgi:hypothetical protein